MLVHTALDRAEQVTRHWVAGGCPVVIHVDKKVDDATYRDFVGRLSDLKNVKFSHRHRCAWGTWGIVAGTQSACEMMLRSFSDVSHVYLASGACLPLRPVKELRAYLESRPQTDFIESATTADVPWTVGGLDHERFTLRFPFSWKTQRKLFDAYVRIQRRLRVRRRIPPGLVPHMGSQWWCLTRRTLSAILQDPDRKTYDAYFRRVWIPDESYFQTLARLYATQIESRSLTLSKFDFQGKPHIFYDDHLQLLRRSDCFVARKIWPRADRIYQTFLHDAPVMPGAMEPNPGKIDRLFAKAVERRTRGRPGLYMQSRWPNDQWENGMTAAPYSVFEGFAELFDDFESWLSRTTGTTVHGHLFAPERAVFADNQTIFKGGLPDTSALRDYNPQMFLKNVLWNGRDQRQCFQFGPNDTQDISWLIAKDPNAQISVVSGAWAVSLFRETSDFGVLRNAAARLQKIENAHIGALRSQYAKARIRVWSLAEFVDAPMEHLQTIIDEITGAPARRLTEAPRMHDLTGFGQFLQNLKNQGMHPYLMGDFPISNLPRDPAQKPRKPYLVR